MAVYEPLEEALAETSEPPAPSKHDSPDDFSDDGRVERIQLAMMMVLEGKVTPTRALKYWENKRLRPQHIQMLIMKAAGYSNRAIAERTGYKEPAISVIVNHPDARFLLSQLVSIQAESLLDIKARIKAHSGEALDTVLDVMRTGEPAERLRASFGLLDRAGYGATQKSETTHRFELPRESADRLIDAMNESSAIETTEGIDWEVIEKQGAGPLEEPVLAGGTGDPSGAHKAEPTRQVPPLPDQLVTDSTRRKSA